MKPRLDPERVLAESREERYRASGPGGQHRNKVETAVRLIHLPTGITAQWSRERSLKQNRESALARLVKRIEAHFTVETPRVSTRPTRGSVRRRLGAKKHTSDKKQGRQGRFQD